MPDVEVGINDRERQGKEIVGRHDIIPIKTEEWIRIIDELFHPASEYKEKWIHLNSIYINGKQIYLADN